MGKRSIFVEQLYQDLPEAVQGKSKAAQIANEVQAAVSGDLNQVQGEVHLKGHSGLNFVIEVVGPNRAFRLYFENLLLLCL
jgi:hypothetical protein